MDRRFKTQSKKPKKYLLSDLEWVDIGYHDSACTCDVPLTILRPSDAYENPYLKGLIYEKGYIGTNKPKEVDPANPPKLNRNPHLVKLAVRDEDTPNNKSSNRKSSGISTSGSSDKDKPDYVYVDMSLGPTSARRPFLVSGPHWASAKHTQRWPWKRSGVTCQLWSRQSLDVAVTRTVAHVSCWSRHHCKKKY